MAIDKDTQKLLLYTAIGSGAYFLILKPILIKLGVLKSALELEQDYTQKVNIDAYINNSIKTQTPTKSKGEWQIIADQIYNDLKFSGASDNKSDAGYQVARVQNEADVADDRHAARPARQDARLPRRRRRRGLGAGTR
jgi:hypothetical protein